MESWTVSVLKAYRSWLKDMIQDQWINPILKTMIENEREAKRLQEQTKEEPAAEAQRLQPKEEAPPPDKDKIQESAEENPNRTPPDITKEVIPIEAIDPETGEVMVYRLNWKIKVEFEPLKYDTFKEKAETAILLKNNSLMTIGAALRFMGVEDENEIAALIEIEEKKKEEQFALQNARGLTGNPDNDSTTTTTTTKQSEEKQPQASKARSVERQRERFKEELRKSITGQNKGIVEGKGLLRGPSTKRARL